MTKSYLLDRLRDAVPAGARKRLFNAITGNRLLRRLALGRDGVVQSDGLLIDCSGGFEHRAAALRVGLYERAERFMTRQFVTGERDVVELGASLGVISCEIARRLQPGRRLLSVEPDPRNADRAEHNLRLNGFTDVTIERVAIDYSGAPEVSFGGGTELGGRVGQTGKGSVPTLTFAQLLERHGIGEFDLVIDIEGAEADLFRNEAEALQRCRHVLIELEAHVIDGMSEVDYLASLGVTPI